MESTTSTTTKEWAESLVGRDWEIYWNDDEDNDERESTAPAMAVDKPAESESYKNELSPGDAEGNNDESSQGSIIDDWYAGRILSAAPNANGSVQFRVLFVGDEQIYEMELSPSKVRPSARGWIKRTTALLCRKGDLPADTATPEDRLCIRKLQEELFNRQYEAISFPNPKEDMPSPDIADLNEVIELRSQLFSQRYLRSKLATIVNLHGSIKYIDGEPNPTEPLVNHLVECCKDLDQACEWYLRCWELLTTCFGQRSGQSSNESEARHERFVYYHKVLDDYLYFGKNAILNCTTMDVESTTSKRRQLNSPPGQRRPKRRRKNNLKWTLAANQPIETAAEEGDFRCTAFVDFFVRRIQGDSGRWYLPIFAKMLRVLSHYIVDPLVHWKFKANQLLGRKDDLKDILAPEDSAKDDASVHSKTESLASSHNEVGENDEMSVDSSDSEKEQVFTYEDVEACLQALEENPVLSLLNVSEEQRELESKLGVIGEMAKEARTWLERLSEDASGSAQPETDSPRDEVLEGLQDILRSLPSSEHLASNIDPIGAKGSSVTREVLEGAAELRRWLLDVRHASQVRERKAFIQNLVSTMEELPTFSEVPSYLDLESLSRRRAEAEQKVREMQARLASLTETEQKYDEQLTQQDQPGKTHFLSNDKAQKMLEELGKLPLLLPAEEKIALRIDLMQWSDEATSTLPQGKSPIEFTQVEKLFKSLQLILKGRSRSGTKARRQLKANEKVENQIRSFVANDAAIVEPSLTEKVKTLYTSSLQWKERAEAIIASLRNHGNLSVGAMEATAKLPSMVDIRRISDLVWEYGRLGVKLPGYTSTLQEVLDDASKWYSQLEKNLLHDSMPSKECLAVLEEASQSRPKGLIMDPTRQVIDTLVDLLEWHQSTKETLFALSRSLVGSESPLTKETFSKWIVEDVYPLLAEGSAVVDIYSQGVEDSYKMDSHSTVRNLEKFFNIRRSARAPTPLKIEAHPFGKNILRRLTETTFDEQEGCPLFILLWIDWHLSVTAFVLSVDEKETGGKVRSLSQAQDLIANQPTREGDFGSPLNIVLNGPSKEMERLYQLIDDGKLTEERVRRLLSRSRELRRGCMEKADSVRQHLPDLKELQVTFKDRNSGHAGLALDASLEPQLDHHVKIFTWLVSYPSANATSVSIACI